MDENNLDDDRNWFISGEYIHILDTYRAGGYWPVKLDSVDIVCAKRLYDAGWNVSVLWMNEEREEWYVLLSSPDGAHEMLSPFDKQNGPINVYSAIRAAVSLLDSGAVE